MTRVFIGAEGGQSRGLGHVMRATSLALEALRLGLEPTLWVWGDDDTRAAAGREAPGVVVRSGEDLPAELDQAGALLLDGPGKFDDLLLRASELDLPSVVLDRMDLVEAATWTILPVLHAEPSSDRRVRQGPAWCVVEPWLRGVRAPNSDSARSGLLVLLGGSDPEGLTVKIGEALAASPVDELMPTFVIGPAASPGRARALARLGFTEDQVLRAPDREDLYRAMAKARLAVCGFGVSLYELAALGTPALHFTRSAGDLAAADRLAAQHIGRALGHVSDFCPSSFVNELETSLTSAWTAGTEAAQKALGDGRGARRILELALGRPS